VQDVIATGDKVAVRATGRSLHKPGGNFFGIAGRGQKVDFAIARWFRFSSGIIAEMWRTADDLGRVTQLGGRIVPPE
jgi:predicted ester cyclase